MKQENAKQLVQAYATDEKHKQHTDLQAPSLCPTILSFKKLKSILHSNKVFHIDLIHSVNSGLRRLSFFLMWYLPHYLLLWYTYNIKGISISEPRK